MNLYLGVDGGGTSTELCLLTDEGEVVASTLAAGTYHLGSAEGVGLVGRILGAALDELFAATPAARSHVRYAFVGLPGWGEARGDEPALSAVVAAALGHDRFRCDNDVICGWAGSLGLADGVHVVCGTGSIGYGYRAGEGARVGGWGETFGDEGSGYWIGCRGLQAFSRMSDRRIPAGPLADVIRTRLGVEEDLDVIDVVIHRWVGDRGRIAGLAPDVVEAARRGDAAAAGILDDAAAELAELAHTARRRLGFDPSAAVPVSYSGGVFRAPEVLAAFGHRLSEVEGALGGRFELRVPSHSPVVGAALYAASLAGAPLGATARERLRQSAGTVG